MSLRIFEYGDGRFRLFHGDREIGWVEGRTVGFAGFDSDDAALRAATVAYDALSGWLARQRREEAAPRRGRRLGMRKEGAERHLTLAGVPVGRLVSAALAGTSRGFELQLPPRIGPALTAAQVMDQALTRHRALRELEGVAATAERSEALV
jgi:hypothetical protein